MKKEERKKKKGPHLSIAAGPTRRVNYGETRENVMKCDRARDLYYGSPARSMMVSALR